MKKYIKRGILVRWVIICPAALFAIIFSFLKLLFKKNGAMSGPVAPTNIELIPLMPPTLMKEANFFFFFAPFKKRYQIIKAPIIGFKKSTFIWLADSTL